MRRAAEFTCCAGLALIVHAGIWLGFSDTGSESAGASGEATISLMAASGDVAEMVKDWTRPVEAMQEVQPALSAPDLTGPDLTRPEPVQQAATPTAPAQPAAPDAQAPSLPAIFTPPPISTPENPAQPVLGLRPPTPTPEAPDPPQPPVTRTVLAKPAPPPPPGKPELPRADTQTARPEVMQAAPKTSLRPRERPAKPVAAARITAPAPQPTGAAAQTAAGNRTGTNAGNAQTQRAASLSPAARQTLMAQWGASIRNRVERRKRYPRGTRASGTTVLRITVARSGRLSAVSVARSSGDRALDAAAVTAVRRSRFPAAPEGLAEAQYHFNLPLAFAGT